MEKNISRTQQARDLMVAEGITAYAAARRVGITPRTLYEALDKEKKAAPPVFCPCCGYQVPPRTRMKIKGLKPVDKV